MSANNWPTERQWLLSRLYYRMDSAYQDADRQGDLLLQRLYRPLISRLHSVMPGAIISWMRFCAQGYHLRLHVFGARAELQGLAQPLIEVAVDQARQQFAALQGQAIELPTLAQRVSLKFAGELTPREPGQHELELLHPDDAEGHYCSFERFLFVQRLLAVESQHSLAVLEREGSYALRLNFWIHYLVQALQVLELSAERAADALAQWSLRWAQFFGIDAAQCVQRAAQLPPLEPVAAGLVDARGAWQLAGLAPSLRPLMRSLAEGQQTAAQRSQIESDPQWSLQAMTLMHLCANRLGLSVLDECTVAQLLSRALQPVESQLHWSQPKESNHVPL